MTTLVKTSPIETVQTLYEAFGRGDVPAIIDLLADDMAFDNWTGNTGVDSGRIPYMTPRFGKQGAAEFFGALGGVEFHRFDVVNMMAGGNQVAVTVSLETEIKATGKRVRDDMIHLWTFNDKGQPSRFLHYFDTAKHIAANS